MYGWMPAGSPPAFCFEKLTSPSQHGHEVKGIQADMLETFSIKQWRFSSPGVLAESGDANNNNTHLRRFPG
jgi:hypothetical protein